MGTVSANGAAAIKRTRVPNWKQSRTVALRSIEAECKDEKKRAEYTAKMEESAVSYKHWDYTKNHTYIMDIHRWAAEGWTPAEIANILHVHLDSINDVLAIQLTPEENMTIAAFMRDHPKVDGYVRHVKLQHDNTRFLDDIGNKLEQNC